MVTAKLTETEKKKILTLAKSGKTISQIAEKLGRARSTVKRIVDASKQVVPPKATKKVEPKKEKKTPKPVTKTTKKGAAKVKKLVDVYSEESGDEFKVAAREVTQSQEDSVDEGKWPSPYYTPYIPLERDSNPSDYYTTPFTVDDPNTPPTGGFTPRKKGKGDKVLDYILVFTVVAWVITAAVVAYKFTWLP